MTRLSRWFVLSLAAAVLLCQAAPQAAGTVTVTVTNIGDGRIVRYSVAWLSDASGDVSAHTTALAVVRLGPLRQIKFIPDAAGTAPTALYDVTLVDANGVDLLAGSGANLSATVSTIVAPAVPLFFDRTGTLDLVVANAGNAKGGTVVIWIGP